MSIVGAVETNCVGPRSTQLCGLAKKLMSVIKHRFLSPQYFCTSPDVRLCAHRTSAHRTSAHFAPSSRDNFG